MVDDCERDRHCPQVQVSRTETHRRTCGSALCLHAWHSARVRTTMCSMQAAEHPSESTGDPRILIVDDDRDIHADFERVLARPQSHSPVRAALDIALFGASEPIEPTQRY